ncbi:hypothetical protein FZI91_04480 [Mycobacterium sp. CBMA271]|uniref:hypothetical protein n=1 Tax=unclassified Mycobacteroides TaxID=2618759 RepID=UPI0012DD7248|nr:MULTISPECIES: hypothetical protein [unclassified Mycobacteroides]MUM20957.1 hypothetical protein [Mycobacteroides sp. CBMA 271]
MKMRQKFKYVHYLPSAAIACLIMGLAAAPDARAYDSWCDITESHGPPIALASEALRARPSQREVDRMNLLYNNVIPLLNTVGSATFWYPDVWGSPDIRPDTQRLLAAMDDLQTAANNGESSARQVQAVDDAVATLHQKCDGKRGLPPREQH